MRRNLEEPAGLKMLKEAFCVFDGGRLGLAVYWDIFFEFLVAKVNLETVSHGQYSI